MPFSADHVLTEAREADDLWLGALEVRGAQIAADDLEFPEPLRVDPQRTGWVFQCAGCDRFGFVVQVPVGGSRVFPIAAWPGAPTPATVVLRRGQYGALLYRLGELEATLGERLEEVEARVADLPSVLWEDPKAWGTLLEWARRMDADTDSGP
jgi:hypothetical protein